MHVHVEVSARMGVCSCVRRVYINCVLSKIKGVTTSICVNDTGTIVIAAVFSSYCLFT